jgi:uridine phosphorylase
MSIKSSELLNPDGSVYHLNLKPEHIAHDIILWKIKTEWRKSPNSLTVLNSRLKREFKTKQVFLKAKNYGDVNRNWS